MTGVRFLFRVTLRRHDLAAEVWHIKEPQKLPPVLSPGEVKRVLIMATSLQARAMLTLAYGCGLRAGDSRGPTSRDFMPWRFLDACQLSVPRASLLPASKNLHMSRRSRHFPDRCSRPTAIVHAHQRPNKFPCSCKDQKNIGKSCGGPVRQGYC